MNYNFIDNLESCFNLIKDNSSVVSVVYYSHLSVAVICLVLGLFVLFNKPKEILNRIFFTICCLFILWSITDIVTWVSTSSVIIMFAWSLFGIFSVLISIVVIDFFYYYFNKKNLSFGKKLFLILLTLPTFFLTPTTYNLQNFDITNCMPTEGTAFVNYYYLVGAIYLIIILIYYFKKYPLIPKESRKQFSLLTAGIFSFFVFFLLSNYLASNLGNYQILVIGQLGMAVFMGFLAYLIVEFRAFDIKLIGAEALVWCLVILIGSQFLFVQNLTTMLLTAFALVVSAILGLIIIRSVRKEILLREQLSVANAGQKNLIHLMNHQIKGYLGLDKNILAELLSGDYGPLSDDAKFIVQKGLEETDEGVNYVTEILRGASAESGSLYFDMKPMDFSSILSSLDNKERNMAESRSLYLNINIEKGNYNIIGDEIQLKEAIRNLIDNSILYTPSGGVDIKLSNSGSKLLFVVKDTGIGIKQEDRERLFKSGGMGKDSLKINVKSSGYGLAFTKSVIEKHNGKVWFESEGEGKGTTFFVEIPLA